jgi:superfamily II DNA or RNA helicase
MARGVIARAWLGEGGDPRLGRFRLRPAQRALIGRVLAAFEEFGGALVVDPPGSGKTIVALGVARAFTDVLVVAPATLRGQWERSAARAAIPIRFVTIESLSRGRSPAAPDLLIVDEAHHARTPATTRYRTLAHVAAASRTLLLSATPVVNRPRDREALLALFLGVRAARLDAEELRRSVLRQSLVVERIPRVRRLPPIEVAGSLPELAATIRTLPPPLPVVVGGEATALIRMSLALAWSSSLAALDRALERRVQRGEAMRDLLTAGRSPSHEALRHWMMTDEGTQLAFAELIAPATEVDAGNSRAVGVLDSHLRAVRCARALIRDHVATDATTRASAIRALVAEHPGRRILVFARHAETVTALHRALRGIPGVVAITGPRVRAVAGRWNRDEVLSAVGPGAAPLDGRDPRAIRVLLATDLLSEGVELTGIGIIVHADLPWTPARLAQRRGRVVRPGGQEREVLETRFVAPAEARAIVRLGSRLRRKRRAAREVARGPEAQARLAVLMRRWAALPATSRVASVGSRERGFIAAVRAEDAITLIAGRQDGATARWRLTTATAAIVRLSATVQGAESEPDRTSVRGAVRHIARFVARQQARSLLGGSTLRDGDCIARVARRLDGILSRARAIDRGTLARLLGGLLKCSVGAGARALAKAAESVLHEQLSDGAFIERVGELISNAPLDPESRRAARPRLVALLLLTPSAPAPAATPPAAGPPSTSPGIAAPR